MEMLSRVRAGVCVSQSGIAVRGGSSRQRRRGGRDAQAAGRLRKSERRAARVRHTAGRSAHGCGMKRAAEEAAEGESSWRQESVAPAAPAAAAAHGPAAQIAGPYGTIFAALHLSDDHCDVNPLAVACDETQSRVLLDPCAQGTFLFRRSSQANAATLSVVTGPRALHKRQNHPVGT